MKSVTEDTADASRLEPLRVPLSTERWSQHALWAAWAFVAIGVGLRLARYLQGFPLWGDECMLAVNFLDRGYLDLLKSLDYSQVAPPLFLWVELTAVKLLGFSEWSLRLFPTLCSIASLLLFHQVARRLLGGMPFVLAVGVFAVSYYPIRHGAEVKQYSLDLLVAVGLITLAVEWWHRPERSRWLWALAAAVPVAMIASLPGAFVAGAVGLALLPEVWRRREQRAWTAFAAYHVAMLASFAVLYVVYLQPQQAAAMQHGLHLQHEQGFPPLGQPSRWFGWLANVHTGRMLAYPVGSAYGGSTATTLCWLIGLVTIWRRGRRELLILCLAPFALGLIAAVWHKYPYGSGTRMMLYLAPVICLAAGLGAATALTWLRPARFQPLGAALCLLSLLTVGGGTMVLDLVRPFKTEHDRAARDFARWFWTEMANDAELVCVHTDLRHTVSASIFHLPEPEYLCYQRIYSPRHRHAAPLELARVTDDRPLRCVLYRIPYQRYDENAFEAWMERMRADFELKHERRFSVNSAADAVYCRAYDVFDFQPRGKGPLEQARLIGPAGRDRPAH